MARSTRLLALGAACAIAALAYTACSLAFASAPPSGSPRGGSSTQLLRGQVAGAAGVALPGLQRAQSPASLVGGAALAAAALVLVAGVSAGSRARSNASAAARRARVVSIEIENDVPLSLRSGSVGDMDAFMRENATEVSLQNLDRIEDKPGEPGVKLCYLEATDFGPFRSQMRLTVRVSLPESGRCDVDILNMENGQVDKKTGVTTFPEPGESPDNFKFDTSNIITWKEDGRGGLQLVNKCMAKSESTLPFWFPLPDTLMQSLVSTFLRRIISGGQEKVMDQMKLKYNAWQQQSA